jgi:hypothetical protein
MNKIEQELENVITNISLGKFDTYEDLQSIRKDIAKDSYSLLEQHCKAFGEFLGKYSDKNRNYKGEVLHAKSKYDGAETTEELFNHYIETL